MNLEQIPNPLDSRYSTPVTRSSVLSRNDIMIAVRGHDQQSEQDVFIKFRDRETDNNAEVRIRREAEVLDSLDHPQIPKLLHADPDAENPYIITELKEGDSKLPDSFTEMANHPFAAELCLSALRPLSHVHDRFIHRDIKPANLVMQWTGAVALVDFDIALSKDARLVWSESERRQPPVADKRLTRDGFICGTAEYMSPEQMRGHGAPLDTRSDIYSVGVVLYQFLYSKPPLRGSASQIVARRHSLGIDFADLESRSIPTDFKEIAERALQTNVYDRYESANEMAEDLEKAVIDSGVRPKDKATIAV
jgi:serine/threonine-protein kinase